MLITSCYSSHVLLAYSGHLHLLQDACMCLRASSWLVGVSPLFFRALSPLWLAFPEFSWLQSPVKTTTSFRFGSGQTKCFIDHLLLVLIDCSFFGFDNISVCCCDCNFCVQWWLSYAWSLNKVDLEATLAMAQSPQTDTRDFREVDVLRQNRSHV